ncbi:MAG: hypothetical protein AB1665_08515, partial [Candidatus Thermoplasmatota archaeon]
YFEVRRGDMTEELGERLDMAVLYLDATKEELKQEMRTGFCAVKDEVKASRQDIKAMHTDLKAGFADVKGSIKAMHADLKEDARKTHEKLDALTTISIETRDELKHIGNQMGEAMFRYDMIREGLTNVESNLGELTTQIKRLVDHMVGEAKKSG